MTFIPEEQYKQVLQMLPICCVDIIILRSKEILLIKRGDTETYGGSWWIPGGRVFKGESWHRAVKRKALTETGINVEIVRKVQSYEEPDAEGMHFVTTLFVTSIIDEDVVTLDETSSDYKWVANMDGSWDPLLKLMLKESKVFDE